MERLSPLEWAAAEALCAQYPEGGAALLEQLRDARVTVRDFTEFGFFTEFEVRRDEPAPQPLVSPFGHVQSHVGPDGYALQFMLYVKEGVAGMIEAYSYGDGYGDLDLLTCDFTPLETPDQDRGEGCVPRR